MNGGEATESESRIASARAGLAVCSGESVYMNIGGAGPLPAAAASAIRQELLAQEQSGRASLAFVSRMGAVAERLRRSATGLVGGDPGEVALTGNTTGGINVALWGLSWRRGDRIVTTALEHPGISVPVGVIARRFGVEVHHIPRAEAESDLEAAVGRACGARTRMVVLSHVAYGTGAVLDVAGAARAADAAGAICVVDGAQSVGAIAVDARALGVHAYAFPAHKWLYGPEGLGAVWIRPDAVSRLDLSFSGYESGTRHTPTGGLTAHPGARRFEMSTPPMALLAGWSAALEWLGSHGWEWVHRRVGEGWRNASAALAPTPGVRVLTPSDAHAGLLTFTVDGIDPVSAAARMVDSGVVVRWLEYPRALRASIGFHWCHSDIRRLAAAVGALGGC